MARDIRCRFLLACQGMMGSMRVMPLLQFLSALVTHVIVSICYYIWIFVADANLERVSDVALLGVGSNYM